MELKKLARRVAGLCVSEVSATEGCGLEIRFTNGSTLEVRPNADRVLATFHESEASSAGSESVDRPTPRQREYLDFIAKYMARFGVAPAETDVQRHFLVSAPSVNQMIKTLERRGFITRRRNFVGQVVPRSIRITNTD